MINLVCDVHACKRRIFFVFVLFFVVVFFLLLLFFLVHERIVW